MRSDTKWSFLGAALLTAGLAFFAQAQPSGHRASTMLASNFDPYTGGRSACPQGAPSGGPKCEKLIPRSNKYPQA
jgi:hypothetical protein